MKDIGLTHIALQVTNIDASVAFYARYAAMEIVHERVSEESGTRVVWISDKTRPFVVVLVEAAALTAVLHPFAHLGVGCPTRADVDRLCETARSEGVLIDGPTDSGYPVGYWAFLRDPDGHTLEIAYGQEVGLTVANA
ncbi:MAG: VOC family protein [Acidobacteria bacterium]|nr:VOC family protein [Acidobacteriota bacterium]